MHISYTFLPTGKRESPRLRTRLQHLKHETAVMAKKVEVLEVAKRVRGYLIFAKPDERVRNIKRGGGSGGYKNEMRWAAGLARVHRVRVPVNCKGTKICVVLMYRVELMGPLAGYKNEMVDQRVRPEYTGPAFLSTTYGHPYLGSTSTLRSDSPTDWCWIFVGYAGKAKGTVELTETGTTPSDTLF
nr:hypothetical protein [Tanacetum cinerariifolium]